MSSSAPPPPEDVDLSPEAEAARAKKVERISRRWNRRRIGTTGFLITLILILAAGLTVRLGVLTDAGRAMVVSLVDRHAVGRFGKLHVEGLTGDVFSRFQIRRLSIVDAKGTWLDARDISMAWRPYALVARRFHAEQLHARLLQIARRPELGPEGKPGGAQPVSVRIDDLQLRLQTLPAFSVRPGDWDVAGRADVGRRGTTTGKLDAKSRLHAGDGLSLEFRRWRLKAG